MLAFNKFINEFPNPINPEPAIPDVIKQFENHGIVPKSLIELWKKDGWGGYGYGSVWTINPLHYTEYINKYVESDSEAIPFLRSAFGDLVIMYKNSLNNLFFELINFRNQISINISVTTIENFFNNYLSDCGLIIETNEDEIFWDAFSSLGELKSDQCYGYHPILALGGEKKLENLKIVNFDNHLKILAEAIESPIIID